MYRTRGPPWGFLEGSERTCRLFDLGAQTLAEELLWSLDVINAERDDYLVAHCDRSFG
jgi:hypothetical protein